MKSLRYALFESNTPSSFFRSLPKEKRVQLREVYDLIGVPQSVKYHPEGDAFEHTMMVIDAAAEVRDQAQHPFAFMLAALTHDLGKKTATRKKEDGDWQALGHEIDGVPMIRRMLMRIGADEETILYCQNLCKLHMRVHTCYFGKARSKATNRLFRECICPEDLGLLCVCDARGKGKPEDREAVLEKAKDEEAFILRRLEKFGEFITKEV